MAPGLPSADVNESGENKAAVHQTVEMIDAQVAHAEQTLEGIGQVFARVERAKPVLDGKVQNIGAKGSSSGPATKTSTTSADIEKNKSIAVQSATALTTSLFSLLWITYLGADAPPEVYAAVAALVPIIGQGVATAINNRKK